MDYVHNDKAREACDEMGQQDGLCEDGEEDYDGNVCEEEYDRSKAAANRQTRFSKLHFRTV